MMKKNYKAILVDDERAALDVLKYLIRVNCPEIKVMATFQDPHQAQNYIRLNSPDLAFVDIRMHPVNGLDFISSLKVSSTRFIITTAHHEYALKAWDSPAISYLLKPVDPADLKSALLKLQNLDSTSKPALEMERTIKLGNELLASEEIIAINAAGAYSNIYLTNNRQLVLSKNLKSILELINSDSFHRIHRSKVINLHHLVSFDDNTRTVVLSEGLQREVSERKLSEFKQTINRK